MRCLARRFWWALAITAAAALAGSATWRAWPRLPPGPPGRGADAYDRADWKGAAALAMQRLREDPGDREALRLLARSRARQGRDEVAQRIFLRLGPESWHAEDHFLIAEGLLRQGKTQLARETLIAALKADPCHPESLRKLYEISIQGGQWDEAARLAERLASIPSREVLGDVLLGRAREALDDPSGTAEALERAFGRDPALRGASTSPESVRKRLARALLRIGRPRDARRHLEAVPALLDDPEAAWLRNRAFLQEGDIPHALAARESARDYRPKDPMAPEPARYVGSARCAECHPAIHRAEQGSRHARTFLKGADLGRLALPEHPVADPARPGTVHTLRHDGDRIVLETRFEDKLLRALVDYAFGSGDRGLTLVGHDEAGQARELRLSRYADGAIWDLTTGQDPHPRQSSDLLGRPLSADEVRLCLDCHTTHVPPPGGREGPEAEDRGIGCERCHGPAGNHLEAIAAGFPDPAIARPRLASSARVVGLCGGCHSPRDPSTALSDPAAVRFQATTLALSRCYTESGGNLRCTTCHDPHRNAGAAPSTYEAKCLACHEASGPSADGRRSLPSKIGPWAVCPVNPRSDCLKCHMPRVEDAVPHSSFTNHQIRVHSPEFSTR